MKSIQKPPFASRLARLLLGLMIVIVPLQVIWLRWLEAQILPEKVVFFATYWYEPLLVLLVVSLLASCWRYRWRWTALDYGFLALAVYALLSFLWAGHSISEHIIGLRFSMPLVAVYFLARVAAFSPEVLAKLFRVVSWLVVGLVFLQVLVWLIPGADALSETLRLSRTFYAEDFPQLYGSLAGPNQLGTVLVVIAIWAYCTPSRDRWWLVGFALLLMTLTFSRSAVLGLVAAGLALGVFDRTRGTIWQPVRWTPVVTSVAVVAVVWLGMAQVLNLAASDTITHGPSQGQHLVALKAGVSRYWDGSWGNRILGYGVGEAGPASIVQAQPFVPESWFVQSLYEYGMVGMILFALIFVGILLKSQAIKYPLASALLVAIAANSLFLHTLSDNPAATILAFALIGSLPLTPFLQTKG